MVINASGPRDGQATEALGRCPSRPQRSRARLQKHRGRRVDKSTQSRVDSRLGI